MGKCDLYEFDIRFMSDKVSSLQYHHNRITFWHRIKQIDLKINLKIDTIKFIDAPHFTPYILVHTKFIRGRADTLKQLSGSGYIFTSYFY